MSNPDLRYPGEGHPVCEKCGLWENCKHPFMVPSGLHNASVMIVGEAPGCITGDSLIEVVGRDKDAYPHGIPICDLVGKIGFYVYSCDVATRDLVLGIVNKVWKTGRKKIYKVTYKWSYAKGNNIVTLTNNIKVTANHKFLLKNYIPHDPFGGIKRDCDYLSINDGLSVGDSIQPFYRTEHMNGKYAYIRAGSAKKQKESRFILQHILGRELECNEQCHHIDGNKANDTFDNLQVLDISEHARLHAVAANPMDNDTARKNHNKAVTAAKYRTDMSYTMKNLLSDPNAYSRRVEQIHKQRKQTSETVKNKFATDPGYYYNYLLGILNAKHTNLTMEWVHDKFVARFPDEEFPYDNHIITCIECVGYDDVYDMEVVHYHNFAVNGIFVHNSEEDREGEPFVGKSGKLLREVLEATGIEIKNVMFTNVVRCRPPDNKIHKKYINYCQQFLLDDIKVYDPDIVLLMGNSPLGAVLGESNITTWNGVVVERPERTYVPLLHPAYILRNPAAEEEWLKGFLTVCDILEGTHETDTGIVLGYPKTVGEIEELLDLLLHKKEISFDTETSTLDQHDENSMMLACSFAYIENDIAYSFAFPYDHPETPFDEDELDDIWELLQAFFEGYKGVIIGHNLKFDWQVTRKHLDVSFCSGRDTILMSHMLTSRKDGHGLKRLAGMYLGMYDYDKPLRDYCKQHPECDVYKGGSYAFVPLDLLLPYAALDTAATIKLDAKLWPELTVKQQHFHSELLMRASDAIAMMEYNGVKLDERITERYFNIYTKIQNDIYQQLLDDPDVQQLIVDKQREADYSIVADVLDISMIRNNVWMKEIRLLNNHFQLTEDTVIIDKDIIPNKRKKTVRKRQVYKFNPNSDYHIRDLLFDYKNIDPNSVEKTATGMPSVSADSLSSHKYIFPIIGQLRYYKLLNKMLSTYLGPAYHGDWYSGDMRVHSNYNIGYTKTGRVASSNPNLQNIPTPEKEPGTLLETLPIKNIFTHTIPKGGLLAVDYSGMELRVMASIANVRNMLLAFEKDLDVHSMVALFASQGMELDAITHADIEEFRKHYNHIRYQYKWTNWTLLYGGSAHTLHNLYGIPLEDGDLIISKYYQAFPEILEFHTWVKKFASTHGYIESVFGRRLQLPYINDTRPQVEKQRKKDIRTALNMPIQSAANDVLFAAEGIINLKMQEEGLCSMLVNTVHDSLMFDYIPDELEYLAGMIVDVMENIGKYAEVYYPHIDFSWLICPLKADVEIGTHYGAMDHYEVVR